MLRTAALAVALVFALSGHARAQDPPEDEPEAAETADEAESPEDDPEPEPGAADDESSAAEETADVAEDAGEGEPEAAPAAEAAGPAAMPAAAAPAPPAPAPPAEQPRRVGGSVGTVKSYDAAKGFGWITPDGGGPDVFVHSSALNMGHPRVLAEGQKVQFQCTAGPKGLVASNVQAV